MLKEKKKKTYAKYQRERRADYMDNTVYTEHSKGPSDEGRIHDSIALKARANLPKSAFAIKADPYEAELPAANPYDLIAPFNKTVGGNYIGSDNLDGGNVQQYANSYTSKTLNAFDFAKLKLAINYRFMPRKLAQANTPTITEVEGDKVITNYTTDYIGSGLIDMQRQSIAEATSILQATTFTQMAINYYAVESDMPMGSAELSMDSTETYVLMKDLPDVIYQASGYYQLFWQEAISVVNWFNSFRLKQGTMIRSSWNRETPTLNSLFGLFNKKAFLSLLDSICLSFEGEYIDTDWVTQFNLLTTMPSRRTNSIHDAVLEIQARHQHPSTFKLHIISDSSEIDGTVFDQDVDLTFTDGEGTITFWDAVDELKDLFSAENIMHWARNVSIRSAFQQNAYYNRAVFLLNIIQEACTRVKVKFNDIREVFDVIGRTGLNTWVKGFRPSISRSTDAALFDNLIIADVYRTVFSGATRISLDEDTKRWRSFTMWDLYDGVPSYDARSGGCFLTFSGKSINAVTDTDKIRRWVPVAFYIDSTDETIAGIVPSMKIVNRLGTERSIVPYVLRMSAVDAFARLVPLESQSTLNLRVPELNLSEGEDAPSTYEASFIINLLQNIFGYCKVQGDYYVDPDLLFAYEIELADVTNDAIRYARINSPFRGAAPEGDTIGFSTFGQK